MKIEKYLTGFQHVGIPTLDMDKTEAFYKKLGFEVAFETVLDGDKVKFFKLGNLVLETYEDKNATDRNGAVDHFAIDVCDIEAAYDEAKKEGLELIDEITFLPFWEKGVKFFNVKGPNGETVEFSQLLK